MPLTIQKNNRKILYVAQFEKLVYCISFFQYPWIRSITSPGNLIKMHVLKPWFKVTELEPLRQVSNNLFFIIFFNPSRWVWCTWTFENYWSKSDQSIELPEYYLCASWVGGVNYNLLPLLYTSYLCSLVLCQIALCLMLYWTLLCREVKPKTQEEIRNGERKKGTGTWILVQRWKRSDTSLLPNISQQQLKHF